MPGDLSHSQLLPGEGALRRNIKAVCRAHDASGKPLHKHVIRIGSNWGLLDVLSLINGKMDDLVRISSDNGLPFDLAKAEYVALGNQIARAANAAAIVLDSSGYQRVRWDDMTYEAFVWRGRVYWFDEEPDVVVVLDEAQLPQTIEAQGTLEDWNEAIGVHFAANPYLMVTLGAALSSLLIRPLALEPLMLILVGRSSTGKTAVQKAVQSIVRPGRVQAASGTALGLRQQMSFEADHPVILQDLHQVNDLANLIGLVFDHGNLARRVVATASQKAVVGQALNSVLIGSNERTLVELVRTRGVHIDAGVDARLLEVFVEGPYGVFHELPDDMDAAAFADHLVASTEALHGTFWDEWVAAVSENIQRLRDAAETLLPKMRAWLERKADSEDPVRKRMLNGYAGWLFAALYAARFDLIPATQAEIKEAFTTVLQAHFKRRAAGMNPADEAIIEAVRASIDENPSRFVPLAQAQEDLKKNGLWGYLHEVDGQRLYLLFKSSIAKVGPHSGVQDTLAVLKATGMLKHNKGELMYSVRMPGSDSNKRFYAVRESIRYDGGP